MKPNTVESFKDKYIPVPESGCWLWEKSLQGSEYGYTSINGRKGVAHRIIYELYRGPVPDGMTLDHLCRVRSCVNPDHLEVVTCKVNVLRGVGVTATNAKKTHCIRGHEFNEKNTRISSHGRTCRSCCALHTRNYVIRKRDRRK